MKFIVFALLFVGAVFANSFDDRLAEIAKEVNSKNVGWKADVSKRFLGKSDEYIMGHFGALQGGPKLPVKEYVPSNVEAPEEFHPIDKWPMCKSLTYVRDQAQCGSCWAFGAVEAATDRFCIHSNGAINVPLSANDMLACCGITCGYGCQGGYPSSAWSWMKSKGVVTGLEHGETQWCQPYFDEKCDHHCEGKYKPCGDTLATPKCQQTCVNGATYSADKHFLSSSYSVSSKEAAIQDELMNNGPIEVAFTVYEDFMTYKSGVYHHVSGKSLGGHAVKMVGWGVDNGVKYWLIANSWNEDWGENGFFRIRRGNNECGVESQGVAGMPKL